MKGTTNTDKLTLGLDLGDSRTTFAVLNSDGEVIEEGMVRTSPEDFQRVFSRFKGSVVALEVGSQSRWASENLHELGLDVHVANPRQLKLIYGSVDKDDKLDALRLARLARFDSKLLYQVYHRSGEAQADLEVLKARGMLISVRTKLINHVRGVLKSFGVRVEQCATRCFHKKALEVVPENLLPGIRPLLSTLEDLAERIKAVDKTIQRMCDEKYEEQMTVVQQVNGVGPITGLSFYLTLGNVHRFAKSRDVGSYLGLRPRRCESGDSTPELRITKAGDKKLRRLLIQSAHYILGPFGRDCDLRRWGLRKAEGGKRQKKRAVVAVARKLSVLLHRLLITGEVYEPLRQAELNAGA